MGMMQTRKGSTGEREVARILRDLLGYETIRRNLQQAREGGQDLIGLDGWAVEVKRAERFLNAYWQQACEQADRAGLCPVLFWRPSRKSWTAFVDLHDINPSIYPARGQHAPAAMSMAAWAQLARETMMGAIR